MILKCKEIINNTSSLIVSDKINNKGDSFINLHKLDDPEFAIGVTQVTPGE